MDRHQVLLSIMEAAHSEAQHMRSSQTHRKDAFAANLQPKQSQPRALRSAASRVPRDSRALTWQHSHPVASFPAAWSRGREAAARARARQASRAAARTE